MAAITYWVDGTIGTSGVGTSFATAFKTIAEACNAVDTTVTATYNQIFVNVVNSTTYTMLDDTSGNSTDIDFDCASDTDVVWQGTDSSGNPALVTILSPGVDDRCWFIVCRTVQSCIVQNFYVDWAPDIASTALQQFVGVTESGNQGTVEVRYCYLRGSSTLSLPSGQRYPLYASALWRNDRLAVTNCVLENMSISSIGDFSGNTSMTPVFDHNVVIVSTVNELIKLMTLSDFRNAANVSTFTFNTMYIKQQATSAITSFINMTWPSGDAGVLNIHDNVIWIEDNGGLPGGGSITHVFKSSASSTATVSGGSVGYNVLYTGPGIPSASVAAYYVDLPFAPDDGKGYLTDSLAYAIADNVLFNDTTSTYSWTPVGAGVTLTVPMDLRLAIEITSGTGSGLPGALPALVINGSGDGSGATSIIEAIYDYQYSLNQGRARQVVLCASNNIYTDAGNHVLKARYYDLQTPAKYTFAQMNEMLVICSDHPQQQPVKLRSTDKSVSILDNAPNMAFAVEHFSRIIGSGMPESPSYIYASKVLEPEIWDFGGNADDPIRVGITVDDGQRITGLHSAQYGQLYVFKERSISRINGGWGSPLDISRSNVSSTRGCISHHTIQQVGNDILFWSDQGCHSLIATEKFGDLETADVSFPIRNTFRRLVDRTSMGEAFSVNYHERDMYITWFKSKGSSQIDIAFVYYYGTKQWSVWRMTAKCAAEVLSDNGDYKFLAGGYDGLVSEWPGSTYHDSVVMTTGGMAQQDGKLLKNYEEVQVHMRPHGDYEAVATLRLSGDDDASYDDQISKIAIGSRSGSNLSQFILGESKLAPNNEMLVVQGDFDGGPGRTATVEFSQEDSNVGLTILGYVVRTSTRST